MKKTLFILFLLITSSSYVYAGSAITMYCDNSNAVVNVVDIASGAKFLGVTATLSNGDYYDFPVEKYSSINIGGTYKFALPNKYKAVSFDACLWKKKKKSKKSWSDKVVNPQGYVMEGQVGICARCQCN